MVHIHTDQLRIERHFSDEEREAGYTVRDWVKHRFLPLIGEHYEKKTFPMHLVPEMAALGLFGVKSDPRWGGSGLSNVCYGIVCRELEYGDSGLRSFVSVQNSLVIFPIEKFGSDEQKERWLERLITGKAIGAFGLTEPGAGSNPASMKTRACKDGDCYVLNGSKQWITNGSIADVVVVWAKTDDDVVRGFLVEKGTPGFTAQDIHGKLSLCASVTSSLFFDDVRIPAANLLPLTKNIGSALSCLNEARYGIAWGAVGAAQACYDMALSYALERTQFDGKPIAAHQLTQEKLVKMVVGIVNAQNMAWVVGKLKDDKRASHSNISMAKMHNVRVALEAARSARTILGANGITLEYHVMRHACNLESVLTYEGTEEIHLLSIGKDITGINAF
jgi:glutaryl-CoA dehydrogenase